MLIPSMHNAFAETKCRQFRAWLPQQAPSVNDACREGEVFLTMRIDERIREEKNGKRDDYQHEQESLVSLEQARKNKPKLF